MSMRGKLRLRSVASALICTLVAGGLLVQVAGHVSANLSAATESDHVTTVEFMDVPAIGAFDLRRSSATRRPAEPPSWREPRDNKAVGIASTQDWSCDTNWDCGSALACDPYTECSVDLYACVVSQRTGRGQCVHRGTCGPCQSPR